MRALGNSTAACLQSAIQEVRAGRFALDGIGVSRPPMALVTAARFHGMAVMAMALRPEARKFERSEARVRRAIDDLVDRVQARLIIVPRARGRRR